MENKEVEGMLNSIKVEYALLEGKVYYLNKDVEKLLEDNQALTKSRYELKQQLQAKDKALDKAIKSRESIDDCPPEHNGCLLDDGTYDGEQYACDFCWKKWCENGKEWSENGTN